MGSTAISKRDLEGPAENIVVKLRQIHGVSEADVERIKHAIINCDWKDMDNAFESARLPLNLSEEKFRALVDEAGREARAQLEREQKGEL